MAGRIGRRVARRGDARAKPTRTDHRRDLRPGGILRATSLDLWLGLLSDEDRLRSGVWVLDLGSGTGRFALPLARRLGCRVVGLDRSPEMLARAREKGPAREVAWCRADAARVPFADGAFGAVRSDPEHVFEWLLMDRTTPTRAISS